MTWLSLVTTITFVSGFVGMSLLSLLGLSLQTQDARTTRQTWNRRMLAGAACGSGAAVVIPFLALGWLDALFFGLGWAVLGALVTAMFSSRAPTRMLGVLMFLSAALFSVVALPPRMGTFDVVGAFVVAGLVLAKLTRMATRRREGANLFRYS
jgi:hypothetical protein